MASNSVPSNGRQYPQIQAIIFDMDGLLIDSEVVYTIATNKFLEPYGKKVDWDFKMAVMGLPAPAAILKLLEWYKLEGVDPADVAQKLSMTQDELFPKVQPLPGAMKLLQHLKKHNVPLAMATGSQRRNLELKTQNLPELISIFPPHAIITGDDPRSKRGKPHPDVFIAAAQTIGFDDPKSWQSCLVFEDGVAGVVGAKAAGMPVIWVPDQGLLQHQTAAGIAGPGATLTLNSLEDFDPTAWGLPAYS